MSLPLPTPIPEINRPYAHINSQGYAIPTSFNDLAFLGDYRGGPNLIYKGVAQPGSDQTAPVWQIAKFTYDGNNNVTAIQWPLKANGSVSNDFEFQWSQRLTYTFV